MFRPKIRCRCLILAALVTMLPATGWSGEAPPTEPVSSADASQYIGETVTICGPVAGTGFFPQLKGKPTFINFDRRYPEQSLTVVIWGEYRELFGGRPDQGFKGKSLCVTGTIGTYKGKPQIVVQSADQIEVHDAGLSSERFSYEERVLLKAMLAALGYEVDVGTGEWDPMAAQAMIDFQEEQGLEDEDEQGAKTLRALAEAVDRVPAEEHPKILRLLLLNLAQREEAAARK